MRIKPFSLLVVAILISSIALNIWQANKLDQLGAQLDRLEFRNRVSYFDEPFVEEAIRLWAEFTHDQPARAMQDRYPVSIHFEDEACIALNLEAGAVGGIPVYCFNLETRNLVRKYDEVE